MRTVNGFADSFDSKAASKRTATAVTERHHRHLPMSDVSIWFRLIWRVGAKKPVAAPAIDKVGPMPYHFRSDPTSGPTTRPQEAKKVN